MNKRLINRAALLVGILSTAACGATPAQTRAANQTQAAEQDQEAAEARVERAEETEEIIDDHDEEAIQDANQIIEETPAESEEM